MVYTVTLNPALDMFLRPGRFEPGSVCRYSSPEFIPGGKGINVSLMLKSLGIDTTAAGISAGFTGRELAALLEREGCRTDFVELKDGLTRVNVKILPGSQPETALNGGGPDMALSDLEPLAKSISELSQGDFLVLAGSVPGALPDNVYARLMDSAPAGVKIVVDTSGPALTEAVRRGPFLIKPNLEELGEVFGAELREAGEAIEYGRKLQAMGARNVAVTLGGGGALLLTEEGRAVERKAIPGEEISSVGAGDSFIAGFIYGLIQEGDLTGALGWAMSAGAATAFSVGIAKGEAVKKLHSQHILIEN